MVPIENSDLDDRMTKSTRTLFTLVCIYASFVVCLYEEHKKPVFLTGFVGGHVLFNCPLEFPDNDHPIPYHLHWRKDGKLIFAWYGEETQLSQQYSGRIHLIDNHLGLGKASINLTSVRESDKGIYQCSQTYPNRSPKSRHNGTWFNLAIEGGTLLRIPPVNQTVMEYEAALFHCSVKNPDTMFVSWFKDGELLSTFTDLASRTIMAADGSLMITPTLMTDFGNFECRIKNILGEEESANAYLNIQYKAKVIYAPKEVFFAYGQQAILDCHFRSNPPLKNLRWEKDGFLFDPYNVKDVFYKRNGSLFFSQVDDLHAGKYTCTPYNELGTDGPSPIIKIFVQHPPEFTLKPKSVYIQKLADTVTMHCSARDKHTDDDRSLIAWTRKDGVPLPFNRHVVEGGNLTIEKINAEDRGVYVCEATNEAARIEADAELLVETFSPKAPSNLTANTSRDSITLRWTQNYIRPDLKFSIWYRPSDSQEWRTHQVRTTSKYESTIKNLDSGKEYEFMVLSQDRYNDGLFSKAFRFRTKALDYEEPEDLQGSMSAFSQIGPPRNVTVEHDGSDTYMVKWKAPDYAHDVLYIVRWYLEPEHKLHGKAETRNINYSVPEEALDDGALYNFQVSSVSSNSYEAFSSEFGILTSHYQFVKVIIGVGALGLLLLLAISGIVFYVKRHLFSACTVDEKS